jgi:hypothetical protein
MSAASQQLVIVIDQRLVEARREIVALEAARAHMSGEPTTAARPTVPRSAAARSSSRATRRAPRITPALANATGPRAPRRTPITPQTSPTTPKISPTTPRTTATAARRRPTPAKRNGEVSAAQLEELLSDGGIFTTSVVAELAGGAPAQVRVLLRELEATGRVRRLGAGRGTRWRAITDEDRIAERAAQLARQSRQAQAAQAGSTVTGSRRS